MQISQDVSDIAIPEITNRTEPDQHRPVLYTRPTAAGIVQSYFPLQALSYGGGGTGNYSTPRVNIIVQRTLFGILEQTY